MDYCLQVAWIAGTKAITEQSNFMFSPLGLRAGLALLATGTDGETLRQLLAFLGSQHIHQLNAASAGLLAEMRAWPQLSFAAGIFVDRSLRLRPEFQSTAAAAHGAFPRSVDFQNQVISSTKNLLILKNYKFTVLVKIPKDTILLNLHSTLTNTCKNNVT
jgi:serpin B